VKRVVFSSRRKRERKINPEEIQKKKVIMEYIGGIGGGRKRNSLGDGRNTGRQREESQMYNFNEVRLLRNLGGINDQKEGGELKMCGARYG